MVHDSLIDAVELYVSNHRELSNAIQAAGGALPAPVLDNLEVVRFLAVLAGNNITITAFYAPPQAPD